VGETLDRVREVLKRLFFGRAQVRGAFFPPERGDPVHAMPRRAPVWHTLDREVRVLWARAYGKGSGRGGEVFGVPLGGSVPVHGEKVGPFSPSVVGVPLLVPSEGVRRAAWETWNPWTVRRGSKTLLDRIPQRRRNGARFLRGRKLPVDGAVLAIFEAVVQKSVQRSVLDKGSGELLLWLRPEGGVPMGGLLVLVRRFQGSGQGLAWQWIKKDRGGGGFSARS